MNFRGEFKFPFGFSLFHLYLFIFCIKHRLLVSLIKGTSCDKQSTQLECLQCAIISFLSQCIFKTLFTKYTFVVQLQKSHMDLEGLQQENTKKICIAKDNSHNGQHEIFSFFIKQQQSLHHNKTLTLLLGRKAQ